MAHFGVGLMERLVFNSPDRIFIFHPCVLWTPGPPFFVWAVGAAAAHQQMWPPVVSIAALMQLTRVNKYIQQCLLQESVPCCLCVCVWG